MVTDQRDVVVVGAGQAGLGAAYCLSEEGLDVLVLERGRIAETWRSQRWDTFALNTPNWMNGLPGAGYDGDDPFGFMTHSELAASFDDYVDRFRLNVRTGVEVTAVTALDGSVFRVTAKEGEDEVTIDSGAVVIASGILNAPRIPDVAAELPANISQFTTATYRSPDDLPSGAVVVVGGGQSGAQIVEDLLGAGRSVYFSISKAPRVPRRYRGRDFMDWWVEMGIWDADVDAVEDPAVLSATNPLVSGVGPLGHTVSYQQLAQRGARLLGRLQDVRDGVLVTDDRVLEYVRHADDFSMQLKTDIDRYIAEAGVDAEEPLSDPADEPIGEGVIEFDDRLDLASAGVTSIVWATGFAGDFTWIELPVTDEEGRPLHHRGVSNVPGIYFIGFPWLSKRKSGVVLGIEEDARHIGRHIAQRISGRS